LQGRTIPKGIKTFFKNAIPDDSIFFEKKLNIRKYVIKAGFVTKTTIHFFKARPQNELLHNYRQFFNSGIKIKAYNCAGFKDASQNCPSEL
jgi:hypothetical protein